MVMAAGTATVGWAAFVAGAAAYPKWRTAVATVAAATVVLVVLAVKQPKWGARVIIGLTALDVAGFAASQVFAFAGKPSDPFAV